MLHYSIRSVYDMARSNSTEKYPLTTAVINSVFRKQH